MHQCRVGLGPATRHSQSYTYPWPRLLVAVARPEGGRRDALHKSKARFTLRPEDWPRRVIPNKCPRSSWVKFTRYNLARIPHTPHYEIMPQLYPSLYLSKIAGRGTSGHTKVARPHPPCSSWEAASGPAQPLHHATSRRVPSACAPSYYHRSPAGQMPRFSCSGKAPVAPAL